jgi:hypothetical protein
MAKTFDIYTTQTAPGSPGTHVLIIGVGDYRSINGASGLVPGMGPLTSPPVSARKFADWILTEFRNTECPLASVAMLISDHADKSYEIPGSGKKQKLAGASTANVKKAVDAWLARGNSSPDNLMIFYFCGHGMAAGMELALLLNDFGKDPNEPMQAAIDFRRFYLGMDKCAARKQVYFIDACREATSALIETTGSSGRALVETTLQPGPDKKPRQGSVFYATLAGDAAFSRSGQVSVYTEALIKALRISAHCNGPDNIWRVDPPLLTQGISNIIRLECKRNGLTTLQINPTDISDLTICELGKEPAVTVNACCDPESQNVAASLGCTDGTNQYKQSVPSLYGWDTELVSGRYNFFAEVSGKVYKKDEQDPVYPPFKWVKVGVQ